MQLPATDPGPSASSGAGGIYGNLAGRASESRFSLTDQFASTRSVLDFGFDDSASSIFDAQSIFSVGTARAPSLYGYDGYEAAAAAAAAASGGGGGLDPFPELGLGSMTPTASSTGGGLQGSPWQAEEEYLGGAYSTVLEENEDEDDTATIGGRGDGDGDGDDNDLTDDNDTPEQTPTKPKRSRAPSSADVTVIGGGGGGSGSQRSPPRDTEILEELQDPLRLPVPVLPPSQRGPRPSYGAAPPSYATAAPPARIPVAPVHRTYYDLFCLSREQFPPPSGAQIRAAYYRLFRLLNSSISNGSRAPSGSSTSNSDRTNLMPSALRPFAAAYFLEIQNAFETLIDPIRRLEYDRYLDDLEDDRTEDDILADDSESEVEDGKGGKTKKAEKASTTPTASYPHPQGPAFVRKYDFQTTTDLGARYTVSDSRRAGQRLPSAPNVTSLDYSLTQSVRVGLPTLRQYTEASLFQLQCRIQRARRLLHERYGIGSGAATQNSFKSRDGRTYYYNRRQSASADQPLWPIRCGIPIVSLSASTYSLSTAAAAAGAVLPLGDRYQPLLPDVLGPARIAQLAHTRASGFVVVGYRQEFWTGSALANPLGPSLGPPPPSVVVEVETEVLPRLAVTARVAQTLKLPAAVQKLERGVFGRPSDEPVHVEAMVQSGESSLFSGLPSSSSPSLPRFGLGLSRRVGNDNGGNIFLCADSGNAWWSSSSSSAATASLFTPFIPPMVEVGYSMSPHELGLHAGRPLTGAADRGLKGVDIDIDTLGSVTTYATDRRNPVSPHGTWTVSAATTGYGAMAAYLRYGRTVFLTPLWRRPPATAAAANSRRGRRQRQSPQRAVRVEAELCAADRFFSDGYLAVRALAPVRWWGLRNGWTSNATTSFRSSTPASTTPPKLGLEVALSAGSGNVHVSLYWSRLGQRIKLPFLLLPSPAANQSTAAKLFVWAAIVPMAVMAVREVARVYWRAAAKQWKTSRSKARAKKRGLTGATAAADYEAEGAGEADFVFDEEEEQAITRHRAEADELTMILASAVDAQRVLERQMRQRADNHGSDIHDDAHRRNELVIISAKYGVALADDPDDLDSGHARHDSATSGLGHGISTASPPVTAMASRNGWAPDYEVADVTAAVSALIVTGGSGTDATDSDYLFIPAGLQKGRLLGFWDPAPNYRTKQQSDEPSSAAQRRARGRKVLHVRYLWNGHERVAEVGDRAELRLP